MRSVTFAAGMIVVFLNARLRYGRNYEAEDARWLGARMVEGAAA
jgi:hypothetical protein